MTSEPEVRQRRRGPTLEAAIHEAVFAELGAVGYGRLSMEGIAVRARTAKSTLYRRWSSVDELLLATLHRELPDFSALPDTGDVRTDLIAGLRLMADTLMGPSGRAMVSILSDLDQSTELRTTAREKLIEPRVRAVRAIFERAGARGEIRLGAIAPFVVQAGPALITHICLLQGLRLTDQDIENIVDQVIMPAVRPAP